MNAATIRAVGRVASLDAAATAASIVASAFQNIGSPHCWQSLARRWPRTARRRHRSMANLLSPDDVLAARARARERAFGTFRCLDCGSDRGVPYRVEERLTGEESNASALSGLRARLCGERSGRFYGWVTLAGPMLARGDIQRHMSGTNRC